MIRPAKRSSCNASNPASPSSLSRSSSLGSDGDSWTIAARRMRSFLPSPAVVTLAVLFLLVVSTATATATTVSSAVRGGAGANVTLHRRNPSLSTTNDADHKSLLYSTREDLLSRATESVSTSDGDISRKRHVISVRNRNNNISDERRQVFKKDAGLVTKVIRRRKVFHIPADLAIHTPTDGGPSSVTGGGRLGGFSNGVSSTRFDEFVAPQFLALLNTSHFSLQPEFLLAQGVGGSDKQMQPFRDFGMKLDSSPDSEDESRNVAEIPRRRRVQTNKSNTKFVRDDEFDWEATPSTENSSLSPKIVVRRKKIRVNVTRDRTQTTMSDSKSNVSLESTSPVPIIDKYLDVINTNVNKQTSQTTKSSGIPSTTTMPQTEPTESTTLLVTYSVHVENTTASTGYKVKINKTKVRQRDHLHLASDRKKSSKNSGVIDSVLSIVRPRSHLAPSMSRLHSVLSSTTSQNDTSHFTVGVPVEQKVPFTKSNRRHSLPRAESDSKRILNRNKSALPSSSTTIIISTTTQASTTTQTSATTQTSTTNQTSTTTQASTTTQTSATTQTSTTTQTTTTTTVKVPVQASTEQNDLFQQSDPGVNSSGSKRKLSSLSSRRLERYRQRQLQRLKNVNASGAVSTTQSTPTSTVSKEKSEVAKVLGLLDRLRNRRRKQSERHGLTNRFSEYSKNYSQTPSFPSTSTTEISVSSTKRDLNKEDLNLISSQSHSPHQLSPKTLPEFLQKVPSNFVRNSLGTNEVSIIHESRPDNHVDISETLSNNATLENADQSSRKDIFIRNRVSNKFAKSPHISIDNSNLLARRLQERKHSFSPSIFDDHTGAGETVVDSVQIPSTLPPLVPIISSLHKSSRISIIPTTPSTHVSSIGIPSKSTKSDRMNNLSHHTDPILDIAPIFVWRSSFPLASDSISSTVSSASPNVLKQWENFPRSFQNGARVDDRYDLRDGSLNRKPNHFNDYNVKDFSPNDDVDSPVADSINKYKSTTALLSGLSDGFGFKSGDEEGRIEQSTGTSTALLPTLPHQPDKSELFKTLDNNTTLVSHPVPSARAETVLETTTAVSSSVSTSSPVAPADDLRPIIELLEVDLDSADNGRHSVGAHAPHDNVFRVELALEKGPGTVGDVNRREGSGSKPVYLVSLLFVVPVLAVAMWYFRSNRADIHRTLPKRLKFALWTAHVDEFRGDFSDAHTSSDDHTAKVISTVETLSRVQMRWQIARRCLKLQHMLGEGNFGQVWKAEADNLRGHGGTMVVAVKNVKDPATHKEKQDLLRELRIMAEMGTHPNIVTLLGCCTHSEPFLLVMEYVMFGKLLTYLRESRGRHNYFNVSHDVSALTSRDLTVFAHQVASAMEFISSRQIVHRDLAARNVLVHYDKTCKVCDFGMSRSLSEINVENFEPKHRGALPIRWMSPESLYYNTYNQRTDCWSYGILLWEIITLGSTPYPGLSAREVVRAVGEGYRLERPDHCHPQLYQLATSCWTAEAALRPDFRQLRQQIEILLTNDRYGYVDLERFQEEIYATLNKSSDEKL